MAMPHGVRILPVPAWQPKEEPKIKKYVAWFWMGPGRHTEYFWPERPFVRDRPYHYDTKEEAQAAIKLPPPGCSIGGLGTRKVLVPESKVVRE